MIFKKQLSYKIAIAATFTREPLEESLSFWMEKLGIACQIEFAPYNQVFQQLMDPNSLLMQNKGGISDEQMEMALKMQAKFMTPAIMSMFMFIWMMILSILLSLIMASILKKENPDGIFAEQTNQPS